MKSFDPVDCRVMSQLSLATEIFGGSEMLWRVGTCQKSVKPSMSPYGVGGWHNITSWVQ